MNGTTWASASVCPNCHRMVKHRPYGGRHVWHGCRLRWIARRVATARSEGWIAGYGFALRNIGDPMVTADLNDYGTGWSSLVKFGGLTISEADDAGEGQA